MISDRFKDTGEPVVPLTNEEQEAIYGWIASPKSMWSYSCPICSYNSFEILAKQDRYGIPVTNVICTNCGLVMINPRYSDDDYARYYKEVYRNIYAPHNPEGCYETQVEVGKQFLKNISFKQNVDILEVGCGAGGHMQCFKDAGQNVIGVDMNEEWVQFAKDKGLDARVGTISDINEKFNWIYYSHVFEHLLDPFSELKLIKERLKEGGSLVIRFPSILEIHQYYNCDIMLYFQDAHNLSFTVQTLTNLVAQEGFELVYGDELQGYAVYQLKESVSPLLINDYARIMNYLHKTEDYYRVIRSVSKTGKLA